mgnify:CR=1 FL=1
MALGPAPGLQAQRCDRHDLGAEALKRSLDQLGSQQVPTDKYELLIENRTVSTLLGHLLRPLLRLRQTGPE